MGVMRAKMKITRIEKFEAGTERLYMSAVGRKTTYPEDGSDEDNTFARFTPNGEVTLSIANPALQGKFEPGETYYLDFTRADS